MAKSVSVKGRAPAAPVVGERGGSFFGGVWSELQKTTWPTGSELTRMTAIVLTTVVIFALIIGAADALLGFILDHFVYNVK